MHFLFLLRLESSSLPTTSPQNMRATWNADSRELKIEWKRRGWQTNSKIQESSVFTSPHFPTFFSCIVYIRYIQHGNTYREKNYQPKPSFFIKQLGGVSRKKSPSHLLPHRCKLFKLLKWSVFVRCERVYNDFLLNYNNYCLSRRTKCMVQAYQTNPNKRANSKFRFLQKSVVIFKNKK